MSKNKNTVKNIVNKAFSAEDNSAATLGERKLGKYNRLAAKMFNTSVLTPKEMMFPAVGQFAEKLLFAMNVYRTLYFVNVLKIDMVYVTLILTLIGIYDVLNNPLMGIIYDKTRTRWGKSRPWILLGTIPYYLSTLVLYTGASFLGERPGNDPNKIIFVFITLFIQETFATIYSIPRENLLSLQSANPKDRINVGLLYEYIGERGSQLIYLVFLPLLEMSNKGVINVSMSGVFSILAIITSVIGTTGNIAMALGCKERILLQPRPADATKTIFYVLKNKYMLRNFLAEFSVGWWSEGGYSWDVVTQQEIFGGTIPTFLAYLPNNVLNVLSVTFIPKFQKFFKGNNRNALLALRIWDLVCAALIVAIGCPFVDNKVIVALVYAVFFGINGINDGPSNVFEAEIKREINDYTEYVTGERPDGTIGLLTSLIHKITAPLNALLTVKLFKWSGYDSTLPMLPWSQGSKIVYQKVFFLYIGISLLPKFVKCIPYFFYDLIGEKREKMYIALNERRALIASFDEGENEIDNLVEMLAKEGSET